MAVGALAVDRDAALDNVSASAPASASTSAPASAFLPPGAVRSEDSARTASPTAPASASTSAPASASLPPGAVRSENSARTASPTLHAQQPSDVTLLKELLEPWVTTGLNKRAEAHVVDIYSAESDELTRRFPAILSEDGNRIWYFLSELNPKSKKPSGCHKMRTVEATGCWRSEATAKNIFDGGRLLGYRQKLSFVRRGTDGARVRTGWVMAEFHLHKYDGEGAGSKIEGLVLGKVYRSNRRHHVAWGGAAKKYCSDEFGATSEGDGAAKKYCSDEFGATSEGDEVGASTAAKKYGGNKVGATPAATAPILGKKYSDNRETEVAATTAAAVAPVLKPARKRAAAAEDKAAPVPMSARKRAAAANDESSAAVSTASWLHYCPRCGLDLGALKANVAAP